MATDWQSSEWYSKEFGVAKLIPDISPLEYRQQIEMQEYIIEMETNRLKILLEQRTMDAWTALQEERSARGYS